MLKVGGRSDAPSFFSLIVSQKVSIQPCFMNACMNS